MVLLSFQQHIPGCNSGEHPNSNMRRDNELQAGAKSKKHKITACLSKPLTTNRLTSHPQLAPPCQTKTMKGKQHRPTMNVRLTVFNQHIPRCGPVGLEQTDYLVSVTTFVSVQGWCRPQLCHTKTLGIFQFLSAAICPLTASQKAEIWVGEREGDLLFSSVALSLWFWERKNGFQMLISWSNMLACG